MKVGFFNITHIEKIIFHRCRTTENGLWIRFSLIFSKRYRGDKVEKLLKGAILVKRRGLCTLIRNIPLTIDSGNFYRTVVIIDIMEFEGSVIDA